MNAMQGSHLEGQSHNHLPACPQRQRWRTQDPRVCGIIKVVVIQRSPMLTPEDTEAVWGDFTFQSSSCFHLGLELSVPPLSPHSLCGFSLCYMGVDGDPKL